MKKAIKIISLCLLGALVIGSCVLYIIDKAQLLSILNHIKDFINQPLPIIGVTTGAILLFVWKLVVTTNYGKKVINSLTEQLEKITQEYEQYKLESEKEKQALIEKNNEIKGYIAEICALSTNKKIKDYGKGLEYGEETDIETTTE